MKTKIPFLVFLVLLIINSCSIEKRVHMSGYHTEWLNQKDILANKLPSINSKGTFNKNKISIDKIAINDLEMSLTAPSTIVKVQKLRSLLKKKSKINRKHISKISRKHLSKISFTQEDCDVITFKTGVEVEVKVLEINQSEIKYKKCNNQNGPTFSINKSDVFTIKYSNGTKDVITTIKSNNSTIPDISSGDKSLPLAILLWFFFGFLGFHRFYLGHIGIGILYLLTGSLCGLGLLIDGILFLTGGLKPKNGSYQK